MVMSFRGKLQQMRDYCAQDGATFNKRSEISWRT